MLRILFRQPIHIWRTLELRHKIEAFLLFMLIFAFLATRLNYLFNSWLAQSATVSGLSLLIINIFTLQLSLSLLFVFLWLLPRQKGLQILLTTPVQNRSLFKALFYYSFKYISVYLILLLPMIVALASATTITSALITILTICITILAYFSLFIFISKVFNSNTPFMVVSLLIITIHHGLFAWLYWQTDYTFLFQSIILLASVILTVWAYTKPCALSLDRFVKYQHKEYKAPDFKTTLTASIPRFLPRVVQALFEKEIAGLWRNNKYRRQKYFSMVLFLIMALFLAASDLTDKGIWMMVLSILLLWVHYSNGFNEKYVYPDPDWLIRTMPIKFRQLLAAKYFSESPLLLFVFGGLFIFLQISGTELAGQIAILGTTFFIMHIILFSMLSFQIMFYNDPRLAGYAYHFTLIFVLIMILNYRLVGPVIALALLSYFTYKNVKYFNS